MRFTYDHDIDSVYQLLTNPQVFIERCEAFGEKNIKCDVKATSDGVVMDVARTVHRDLPGPLAKIAKSENTISSSMTWKDEGEGKRKSGSYTATVEGSPIPITIKATYSLEPKGEGQCDYVIDFDVKAKHMLLGKIAQKFVLAETEKTVPEEVEYNKKKLAAG